MVDLSRLSNEQASTWTPGLNFDYIGYRDQPGVWVTYPSLDRLRHLPNWYRDMRSFGKMLIDAFLFSDPRLQKYPYASYFGPMV